MSAKTLSELAPLSALYVGEKSLFQSEQSARWYLFHQRARLVQAGALAVHRGRIFVDLDVFDRVARDIAVEAASRRFAQPSDEGR